MEPAKKKRGGYRPGAGRPSAYVEMARANAAQKIFFEVHDQEELEKKITSGKFAVVDRFILTAMEGDTAALNSSFKKAVPDLVEIKEEGTLKVDF